MDINNEILILKYYIQTKKSTIKLIVDLNFIEVIDLHVVELHYNYTQHQ